MRNRIKIALATALAMSMVVACSNDEKKKESTSAGTYQMQNLPSSTSTNIPTSVRGSTNTGGGGPSPRIMFAPAGPAPNSTEGKTMLNVMVQELGNLMTFTSMDFVIIDTVLADIRSRATAVTGGKRALIAKDVLSATLSAEVKNTIKAMMMTVITEEEANQNMSNAPASIKLGQICYEEYDTTNAEGYDYMLKIERGQNAAAGTPANCDAANLKYMLRWNKEKTKVATKELTEETENGQTTVRAYTTFYDATAKKMSYTMNSKEGNTALKEAFTAKECSDDEKCIEFSYDFASKVDGQGALATKTVSGIGKASSTGGFLKGKSVTGGNPKQEEEYFDKDSKTERSVIGGTASGTIPDGFENKFGTPVTSGNVNTGFTDITNIESTGSVDFAKNDANHAWSFVIVPNGTTCSGLDERKIIGSGNFYFKKGATTADNVRLANAQYWGPGNVGSTTGATTTQVFCKMSDINPTTKEITYTAITGTLTVTTR